MTINIFIFMCLFFVVMVIFFIIVMVIFFVVITVMAFGDGESAHLVVGSPEIQFCRHVVEGLHQMSLAQGTLRESERREEVYIQREADCIVEGTVFIPTVCVF